MFKHNVSDLLEQLDRMRKEIDARKLVCSTGRYWCECLQHWQAMEASK